MPTPRTALLTATAALATAVVAPAPPALAAPVPAAGAYYVQSATTGFDAADDAGAVEQHRPKGNDDRQQWTFRASGTCTSWRAPTPPAPVSAAPATRPTTVACTSPDAAWEITPSGADQYTLKAPGTTRYLTVAAKPSGANYPDQLAIGGSGGLAAWYLTPVAPTVAPMPSADQRTLDQVTFLTAHNAYANGVDGGFAPPFVNFVPNQARGINQQLTDGVRGFMLDIHQTSDGAILCHNSCTLVGSPVALWVDLQRMVDFLKQNPTQVVTVFLEDYVDPSVLRGELARVNGLSDVLYRPDQNGVRQNGWPKIADLIAANDRLLIFTDHSRSADQTAGLTRGHLRRDVPARVDRGELLVHGRRHRLLRLVLLQPLVRRRLQHPADPHRGRLQAPLRHEPLPDVAIASTATNDNTKLADRAQRFCQPAARKKPNFLAVDRYDLGNSASAVATLNTYVYP